MHNDFSKTLAIAINISLADYLSESTDANKEANALNLLLLWHHLATKHPDPETELLRPLLRALLDSYLLLVLSELTEEDFLLSQQDLQSLLSDDVKEFLRRYDDDAEEILRSDLAD